jgi:Flp pilus assembly protein CpaB
MNPKRILLVLALALLISVVSTWLVARRLNTPASSQSRPDRMYAAPTRALDAGEVLKPDSLGLVAWHGSDIDGVHRAARPSRTQHHPRHVRHRPVAHALSAGLLRHPRIQRSQIAHAVFGLFAVGSLILILPPRIVAIL